jgi:acid phosphatase
MLLGDSFYPKGVQSVHDPQFRLFDAFSDLSDSFYVALGNHDYGYSESPAALLAYSSENPKWIMPAKFFLRRLPLGGGKELCMFVLDSHVFEPPQLNWLRDGLAACQSSSAFRIIFTHYPLLTVGLYTYESKVLRLQEQLFPLIREYGVHAYVSGHEHQMQAFEREGVHYLVSGATAQMNRHKEGNPDEWKHELRFVETEEAGILAFTLEDDVSLSYKFIRASDGAKLYGSRIRLENVSPRPKPPKSNTSPKPPGLGAASQVAYSQGGSDDSVTTEAVEPLSAASNSGVMSLSLAALAILMCSL